MAVTEGSLERRHELVACSWVQSGPHSVSKKFKIVANIESHVFHITNQYSGLLLKSGKILLKNGKGLH